MFDRIAAEAILKEACLVLLCFALLRFFLFGFFGCAVCTAKPSADEIIKQNVNKSGTKAGRSVTTTAAVRVDGQTR